MARSVASRSKVPLALSITIASALLASPRDARAGNSDTYHLSNDAAIIGGAVTATVKGGGAVWYNPAGLAADTRSSVDVAANAYVVRFGGNPDFVADPSLKVDQKKLSTFDFNTVPTSLAYTRRVGSLNLGFGIFVPSQRALLPRSQIRILDAAGNVQGTTAVDGFVRQSDTYAGFGAGFNIGENIRLGASLFALYSTLDQSLGTIVADERTAHSPASITHETIDQVQLGMQLVWGLKWTPTPKWAFGLTMRSPVLQVYHIPNHVVMTVDSGIGANAPSHTITFDDRSGFQAALLRPMRTHLGITRLEEHVKYSLELSTISPFYDTTTNTKTRGVFNAGGGARWRLSPTMAVGGGFHTDFSEAEENAPTRIDYYSFSLGTEFGTAFKQENEDDPTQPVRHTITTTTLAMSYAFGIGHLANEAIALQADGTPVVNPVPAHVVAHEIMFYLGSSVAF
jgi:hypothetical protein